MLRSLVATSGVPRDRLVAEIKTVHQRHKTSEYVFLIQELPSLVARHPVDRLTAIYSNAIRCYREGRSKSMALYPGVEETLRRVREKGTLVIGYTESMAFYTNYRVRHLGLDLLMDYVYSPEDHDIPPNVDLEKLRLYPKQSYELTHAQHRYTPKAQLKPSSTVLKKILNDLRVAIPDCIYVGDSLMKDVSMANEVGVTSVHAAYGEAHERKQYELLKEVTHWSDEDVMREKTYKPGIASYSLKHSFSELLDIFDFRRQGATTHG